MRMRQVIGKRQIIALKFEIIKRYHYRSVISTHFIGISLPEYFEYNYR